MAYVLKIALEREKKDYDKLEHMHQKSPLLIIKETERVRRVTWRMGIVGSALSMFLVWCMKVKNSSLVSIGVVSWITITACLNFRAYHVEDIGMQKLIDVLG
jgi:hypothetical protein